jgi:peptide/nickel transport system permease protein
MSAAAIQEGRAPWRDLAAGFFADRLAAFGFVLFVAIAILALFAPWLAPQDPYDLANLNLSDGRLPPGSTGSEGVFYFLGTDDQGRDLIAAIMYGFRVSLGIGAASSLAAMAIGTTVGLASAYIGGWLGDTIMRIVDFQLSIPAVLLALMMVALVGSGIDKIFFALVVAQWAYYARTVRGIAIVEMQADYVAAARGLCLGPMRILFSHLLPNCLPPLLVVVTIQIAAAIALEATLSFLGLGLPISEPSLGLLLANGFQYMLSGRYWMSLFPGIALLLMIVAINLIGDRLRDLLNVRLQK